MTYDKESVYNDKIKKHITEIRKICVLNGIPFFFAFCTKNDDNKSQYRYHMFSGMETELMPTQNNFPEFVKVMCGMKVEEKRPDVIFADEENDSILEDFVGENI